jgi:hypothetical protein
MKQEFDRYIDYETLKKANSKAVRQGFNRTLHWKKLPITSFPPLRYPVAQIMLHEYRKADAVRSWVMLNEKPEIVILDIPIGIYNGLRKIEQETN